jgi:hypothetical protein
LDDRGRLGQLALLHEAHRLRNAALHLVAHSIFSSLAICSTSMHHLYGW